MHRHIRLKQTVHAKHAQPVVSIAWVTAQPHKGRGDWEICSRDQFAQQLAGNRTRVDDPASGIKNGLLRNLHRRNQSRNRLKITFQLGLVMRFHLGWPFVGAIGKLHILRDIDQNRSRPTRTGHMKGAMKRVRQSIRIFDQPIVFGTWARDANGIGLLESIGADHEGRHLPCQNHQGDAVHQSIG